MPDDHAPPPPAPTVVLVPGLRAHDPEHWQSILAEGLDHARIVPPVDGAGLDLQARVRALDEVLREVDGPVVLVAHSAGCLIAAHWALTPSRSVLGAILATPADLDSPLPEGYPSMDDLRASGWLPTPRRPLPFPAIVVSSRNDPLATPARTAGLAAGWGARLVDVGEVGHLNPVAGFGPWPTAVDLLRELARDGGHAAPLHSTTPRSERH